ncbi:MAG: hypothetical protein RIG26_09855 [Thalassospira sp.]|uniref:hypothetical protein n=1 Tax=Thalassospira sp. TaxID=1912094 RepID=UPI0032EB9EE6
MNKINLFGFKSSSVVGVALMLLASCQTSTSQQGTEENISVDISDTKPSEPKKTDPIAVERDNLTHGDKPKSTKDWPAKDVPQVVSAFDVTIGYPLPIWYDPQSQFTANEQIAVTQDETVGVGFQRNQYPMVAGKVSVDQFYVLRFVKLPIRLNDQFAERLLRQEFAKNCLGKLHSYGPRTPKNTSVFFCQKMRNSGALSKSEIAVARWFIVNDVMITLFHVWIRDEFDYRDEKTWPVSQKEIDEVIKVLGTVETIPFGLPIKVN